MPPLAPTRGEKSSSSGGGNRQRQETLETAAWERSVSFHGSGAQRLLPKQRPKTQPDLLLSMRGASSRSGSPPDGETTTGARRTPSKVLVSVSVQHSMWPLHVMASAEWRVSDLVAAAVALYVKKGRRPALASADPADFGLHYSQFSLESLDPSESHGIGVQELLPLPQVFSSRFGHIFTLLHWSKWGHHHRGFRKSRRNTGLAELHAVLADYVVGSPSYFHPQPSMSRNNLAVILIWPPHGSRTRWCNTQRSRKIF